MGSSDSTTPFTVPHSLEEVFAAINDPRIVFEIARNGGRTEVRVTHLGLVPAPECYGECSAAWTHHVNESLFRRISKVPRA